MYKKPEAKQSDQSIQGVGNENREVLDGSTGLKDTRTRDNNPNPGTSKTRDLSDLMRDLDTIPNLLKKRKSSTRSRHIQDHLNSTANKAKKAWEKYGDHELSNISRELRSLARSFDASSLSNLDGKNIPPGKGGGMKSPQRSGKGGTKGFPREL